METSGVIEKPKRGRRRRITEAVATDIYRHLANGLSIRTTCRILGVGEKTFFTECQRNSAFRTETDCAREKGVARLVLKIQNHDDWRGAAWLLERMFPERFGRVEDRKLADDVAASARPFQIILNVDGKLKKLKSIEDAPDSDLSEFG
jgi:hypothetical protein